MLRRIAGLGVVVAVVGLLFVVPAEAETSYGEPVSPTAALLLGAPIPVSASVGVFTTEVRWTRRTDRVTYGTAALLEGQVTTSDGALPDVAVHLYGRPVGARDWSPVATRRTSAANGRFRFDPVPVRTTDYRVVFRGELLYGASEAVTRVSVARKVTSAMARNADGTFTMKGTVAPRYVGRTVRLQRKTCSSCAWTTISSAETSSTSTWKFRVTGPGKPGTWSFRAVVPSDSYFLAGSSDTWLITRR